jgi:predicted RND superfamily exporter protein
LLTPEDQEAFLEANFASGMADGAVAITVTSLSNAAAFYLGSLSQLPAIQAFCIYAGTGVLFDFLLQITMFAGVLAVDIRRMSNERVEVAPCLLTPAWKEEVAERASKVGDSEPNSMDREVLVIASTSMWDIDDPPPPDHDATAAEKMAGIGPGVRSNRSKTGFSRRILFAYARQLKRKPVRIAILVAAACVTVLAAVGTSQVQRGLPYTDLARDDSYAVPFQVAYEQHFRNNGNAGSLMQYIPHGSDFDYTEGKNLDALVRQASAIDEYKFVIPAVTRSWVVAFRTWLSTSGRPLDSYGFPVKGNFYTDLGAFLLQPQSLAEWASDMKLENGKIVTSRIRHEIFATNDAVDRVATYHHFGEFQKDWQDSKGLEEVYVYAPNFIFVATDVVQEGEMITNLSLATTAVFVVAAALMIHPLMAFLIVLMIINIDIWLFGWMYAVGVRFNAVSVVNLVMAIGLSFDYVGHIGHGFIDNDERTRLAKMQHAVTRLGVPVFHGSITTLLGVLVLSFSGSTIFRVFFKMFVAIVGFGFLHGMVILPAVLSFVGPLFEVRHPNRVGSEGTSLSEKH